jgi:excisionase family DNA binding protein
MENITYNNLPQAIQGLYGLFKDIHELKILVEKSLESRTSELVTSELLTRKEAADLLGVSLPTLNDWTKNGIVQGYRIASRVRYKKSELESSLKIIRTHYKN